MLGNHRDAGLERGRAQPPLHRGFRLGELRPCVDAAHLILPGLKRHGFQRHAVGDRHRIGQVEFALGILVVDAFEDVEHDFAAQRHQPAIAEIDPALDVACVLLLADGDKPVAVHHEPTISARIGCAKSQHRNTRVMIDRGAQPLQRVGADQRRIAEDHQDIVSALGDGRARDQYRVGRPAPLGLGENLRLRHCAAGLFGDGIRVRPDHDRDRFRPGAAHRAQHMPQHRSPRDRVQHLRHSRTHACAFAGGKHDREASSFTHRQSGPLVGPSYWGEVT